MVQRPFRVQLLELVRLREVAPTTEILWATRKPLALQEVADRAGVNPQTLRYYERRGLLPEPPRRESGYRISGLDAVRIVRLIKRAQELGFSLDEVESLLELAGGGPESCDTARHLAQQRVSELDRRIAALQAMRDPLDRLLATCSLPRTEREFPLLQSIEQAVSTKGDDDEG